jgi:C4-dicarboxylate-specific signal transduction histidine kinase
MSDPHSLPAGSELNRKVEERTAELWRLNDELRVEIAERKRVEVALRKSETYKGAR